jgi:hypothetical protein
MRLWLRCGRCADTSNLATVTGPGLSVYPRPDGSWHAYPRKGSPAEFTHLFRCRVCGYREKVGGERLDEWWAEFAATGRHRDVRYLGRDR